MEVQLKRLDDPSTDVVNFHLAFQIKTSTGRSAGLKFMREYVLLSLHLNREISDRFSDFNFHCFHRQPKIATI